MDSYIKSINNQKRTTSEIIFAAIVNNVVTNQSDEKQILGI